MISIIKMISAFFLLSLFTISASQARMLLPAGENGTFKTISNNINCNKEKKWISMVADQITTSSFMISSYSKRPRPSPPPPRSATPVQPGTNEYSKWRLSQLFSFKSGTKISSIIKRPERPPPPAPGASPSKTGMSEYSKKPRSPPPSPYISPTKGHLSSTTGSLNAKPPPPPRSIYYTT